MRKKIGSLMKIGILQSMKQIIDEVTEVSRQYLEALKVVNNKK